MAKKMYEGVSGVARQVKKQYAGVSGVARKIKKAYIGVSAVARQFFAGFTVIIGTTAQQITCYSIVISGGVPTTKGNMTVYASDTIDIDSTGSIVLVNPTSYTVTRDIAPTNVYMKVFNVSINDSRVFYAGSNCRFTNDSTGTKSWNYVTDLYSVTVSQ